MSHHITLEYDPSYPNNSPSNFYALLDETLVLTNKYEVALTEFYYPNDYNVSTFEYSITRPNFRPASNPTISNYYAEFQRYTEADETTLLSNLVNPIQAKNKQLYDSLVVNFNKIIGTFRVNASIPEVATSSFKLYQESLDEIYELIETYPLDKSTLIIDTHKTQITNIISLIESFSLSETATNNAAKRDMLNAMNDFFVMVDNYSDPMFVIEEHSMVIPDRCPSSYIFDQLLKSNSALFYTTQRENVLFIKPQITFTSSSPLISISPNKKLLTVKKRECIAVVKSLNVCLDVIAAINVPVIKTIKPEGLYMDYVSKSFDYPLYLAVNKNIIYKIQVQIKDHNNNFIDFNTGPVTAKLHFRKVKT